MFVAAARIFLLGIYSGSQETGPANGMESTITAILWKIWSEQDIQSMVLISLILQLFMLFAGTRRRGRRIGGLHRLTPCLAYIGADTVAVFAIGLFSRYEEKYKLRSRSGGSHYTLTVPFLWAPFLLLHLGGQDTISAFSIEDNNLWLRHLLNLVIQVIFALYIFCKSIGVLDAQLLSVAVLMYVAGIIKYVERTWALQRGSRDSLGSRHRRRKQERNHDEVALPLPSVEDYALNSVLRGRELLVGRTLFQLGTKIQNEIVDDFAELGRKEGKLKIVMMELGMMYDLLYTKAMVLRCKTGRVLRCVALMSMVLAFALFLQANYNHGGSQHANVAITNTLFVVAIFMEVCSICMAIASPWTRAWSKEGTFFYWLSNSLHNAAATKQGYLSSPSMGGFNLTDYSLSEKCTPKIISKVIAALNLDKHWRNLWYIESVDDSGIFDYMVGFFEDKQSSSRPSGRREGSSQQLELGGRELNYLLTLPFEHALFRLHIFTDLHLSKAAINPQLGLGDDNESIMITKLVGDCRKLSNYMMYLMAVNPSMLPVSSAAQDLEPFFAEWVRDNHGGTMSRTEILEKYAAEKLTNSGGTFASTSPFLQEHPSVASLKEVKEVWARLLIYAAGKCPMEEHARQLGNGLELLTVIGWFMMHHGLGDVGIREHNLLSSGDPNVPIPGSMVSVDRSSLTQRTERPLYAFEFLIPKNHQASVPSLLRPASSQQQLPRSVVRAWSPHNDIVEDELLRPQFAPQNPNAFPSSSEIEEADQSSETLHGLDIHTLSPQYQPNTPETDVASELYFSASEIELANLSSEIHQLEDLPQQFASQPITTVETDVASEIEQKQAEGAVLQIERADMALEISCMMAT